MNVLVDTLRIVTTDSDFELFAKHLPIKLHSFLSRGEQNRTDSVVSKTGHHCQQSQRLGLFLISEGRIQRHCSRRGFVMAGRAAEACFEPPVRVSAGRYA
jgi:hypothetical protein